MTANNPESQPARRPASGGGPTFVGTRGAPPQNLADILERVLDKGIVIAGDIQVRLLDIELLTIKVRLLVASVDRAREMGINWWESDPFVSSVAEGEEQGDERRSLQRRVEELERRISDEGAPPVIEQPERKESQSDERG